mmetsp:Transcript_22591/g.51762  ORF Transcript_22591/g.51762 Transcript_22591/m.51762 type:complete len:205 (-) Transcript_22591:216-830(-)
MVGICCSNGILKVVTEPYFVLTLPSFLPTLPKIDAKAEGAISKLVVQHTPLKSVLSLITNLNLRFLPSLSPEIPISMPVHFDMSSDLTIPLRGRVRMPTKPPLFASVTVPLHTPEEPLIADFDAPPITTSSSGAHENNEKRSEEAEDDDQSTLPGAVAEARPSSPRTEGSDGGEMKRALCEMKRLNSQGTFLVGVSISDPSAEE